MSAWIRVEAPQELDGDHDLIHGRHVLAEGLDVALDMFPTEVLTSSGCAALLRLHQFATDVGRQVTVICDEGLALNVLRLTGLVETVEVIVDRPAWSARSFALID